MMIPRKVVAQKKLKARNGAAAVELASLLPILLFLSMATADFGQVAYVQVALQNAARNGAVYEFYKKAGFTLPTGWTSLATAVNADVPSGMVVTAVASSPASTSNNTVTVTVTTTCTLNSIAAIGGLPAIPSSMTLSQSATMPFPNSASPVN